LDTQASEHDLKTHFEKYGELMDIFIPRERYTQKSRGFGFVTFKDVRDAEDAIDGACTNVYCVLWLC
jgi:RNA recognition motif-containing protein